MALMLEVEVLCRRRCATVQLATAEPELVRAVSHKRPRPGSGNEP